MEVSEEINACSIEITVHTNQGDEQWLLMFKNETRKPSYRNRTIWGAATCLGGAIRHCLRTCLCLPINAYYWSR